MCLGKNSKHVKPLELKRKKGREKRKDEGKEEEVVENLAGSQS